METLTLVIPVYNEEAQLPLSIPILEEIMRSLMEKAYISGESKILFVDDGSRDKSWEIIENCAKENPIFKGVKLSRNRGQANAILAGLTTAIPFSDITITMDVDLQDDPAAIEEMLKKHSEGADIVYGVRDNRDSDTGFKRGTALLFYKIMKKLGSEAVYNHAEYRLMSRRAVEGLLSFPEANPFLRGLVPLVGYKSEIVYYRRGKRSAGESKYPLKKMMDLALFAITAFSGVPLRMILWGGVGLSFFSFIGLIVVAVLGIMNNLSPFYILGFAMALLAGVILLALGIIGEYIGKIAMEVRGRPRFIIDKIV